MTSHYLPTIKYNADIQLEPTKATNVTNLGYIMHDLKTQDSESIPGLSGTANEDPKEPLQNRLLAALHETPGCPEKKGFFPIDQLCSLVPEECVAEELKSLLGSQLDDHTIRKYSQEVCGVAPAMNNEGKPPLLKKIFVTLVLCEKTSTIGKFIAERVTDNDLPLVKIPRQGKSASIFDLGRRGSSDKILNCFHTWSACAIRLFEEWQWTTLAPFFGRDEYRSDEHWILQNQVILPFTSDSRREVEVYDSLEFGGFSQVFRVDIHPEHHNFRDARNCNGSFAIKRLLSQDKVAFQSEVEMLKKFSRDRHPHLVSLLSAYEQFRRFYLVFHWADADLENYWEKVNPKPVMSNKMILWMAEQCKGIADGLSNVHRYRSSVTREAEGLLEHSLALEMPLEPPEAIPELFGRHGDIKPANVLWFKDPDDANTMGTLKIADFGLAEFNPLHSKLYKPKSKIASTPTYRPPECDLQGGIIGPSYDIWTLGCLYLEFITWLVGGWELVQKFAEKRISFDQFKYHMRTDTFFEITLCSKTKTAGARIKPAVENFISKLHSEKVCTEYLHEFIDLIQWHMLIVKPDDLQKKGRLSCSEIHVKLSNMLQKCKCSIDYTSKPVPRLVSTTE